MEIPSHVTVPFHNERLQHGAQDCTRLHKAVQNLSISGAVFQVRICTPHHMEKLSLEDNADDNSELNIAFTNYADPESVDSLSLYEIESQILSFYDQLIELRLERAILETQLKPLPGARKVDDQSK